MVTGSGSRKAYLALGLLSLAWLPVVADAMGSYGSNWNHLSPIDTRDGLVGVLGEQASNRMINLIIGSAARKLADGKLKILIIPKNYRRLLDLEPDDGPSQKENAMKLYLLKRIIPRGVRMTRYNSQLSMEEFDGLLQEDGIKEYPMNVYTLHVPSLNHKRLRLLTDVARKRVILLSVDHPTFPLGE